VPTKRWHLEGRIEAFVRSPRFALVQVVALKEGVAAERRPSRERLLHAHTRSAGSKFAMSKAEEEDEAAMPFEPLTEDKIVSVPCCFQAGKRFVDPCVCCNGALRCTFPD